MCYAVKLGTDHSIKIVKQDVGVSFLNFCEKQIGCGMIEIVHPRGLAHPFTMIVDDEGLLQNNPIVNVIASYLYGAQTHNNFICGDALIAIDVVTNSGPDVACMTEEQAQKAYVMLTGIEGKAAFEIICALGGRA